MNYNIYSSKTNLSTNKNNNYIFKTIIFDDINNVENELVKIIKYFFNKMKVNKNSHILIVGIGNDNYIADSVGPKTLKNIKVNSFLENLDINIDGPIISSLEPGVLSETGILTEKIIKSVTKEIKPDLVILIDSFISNDIKDLNRTIEVNNKGLSTGMGVIGINSNINEKKLKTPIITIGVTTAVEVSFSKKNINYIPYILSTKDVDKYINSISKIIASALNKSIDNLK